MTQPLIPKPIQQTLNESSSSSPFAKTVLHNSRTISHPDGVVKVHSCYADRWFYVSTSVSRHFQHSHRKANRTVTKVNRWNSTRSLKAELRERHHTVFQSNERNR